MTLTGCGDNSSSETLKNTTGSNKYSDSNVVKNCKLVNDKGDYIKKSYADIINMSDGLDVYFMTNFEFTNLTDQKYENL